MPEEIIKKTEKKKFFQGWGKVFLNTFLVLFAGFLGVIIYLIVLAADLPSFGCHGFVEACSEPAAEGVLDPGAQCFEQITLA